MSLSSAVASGWAITRRNTEGLLPGLCVFWVPCLYPRPCWSCGGLFQFSSVQIQLYICDAESLAQLLFLSWLDSNLHDQLYLLLRSGCSSALMLLVCTSFILVHGDKSLIDELPSELDRSLANENKLLQKVVFPFSSFHLKLHKLYIP